MFSGSINIGEGYWAEPPPHPGPRSDMLVFFIDTHLVEMKIRRTYPQACIYSRVIFVHLFLLQNLENLVVSLFLKNLKMCEAKMTLWLRAVLELMENRYLQISF